MIWRHASWFGSKDSMPDLKPDRRRRSTASVATMTAVAFAASMMVVPAPAAFADPPPWAPAHGWRAKHNQTYRTYREPVPFGIDLGHCNRQLLGSVLGGVAGGVIGSQVGKGDGRTVAIIGGTLIGVLIGGALGRAMDEVDQNCVGQVLEHAEDGRTVRWQNPNTGTTYDVEPRRTYTNPEGAYCREYTTTAVIGGRAERVYGTACRNEDGSWKIAS